MTAALRPGRNAIGVTVADGWYRGRLGFGGGRASVYGDRLGVPRPAPGRRTRTGRSSGWSPTRAGGRRRRRSWRRACTTARPTTPGSSATGWSSPGFDDAGWEPVERIERDPATLVAPFGPPVRRIEERRAGRRHPVARRDGRSSTSARTSSAGSGSRSTARPARRSRSATPRCWRTASCARGPLRQRPGHRPLHPARRRPRDVGAALHLPRLPLRRGRRLAGRACGPTTSTAVVLHSRPGADRLVRVLGPAPRPAARERRLGHARQLPRRPDRLPAARRAPRLDRRHRRCSRRRRRSSTTSPGSSPRGWRTSRSSRSAWAASFPWSCRTCWAMTMAAAAWGDAATVVPDRAPRAHGDARRARGPVRRACGPGSTPSPDLAGDDRTWDTGFQFGDWLDPTAPPDQPGRARTDKAIVMTAYFARSAVPRRAARRASSGRSDDERRYRAARGRGRGRLRPRVRHRRPAAS